MAEQMFITLPSGKKMPALGIGTWQAKDEAELEKALNIALEKGYRHIDTAFVYENEHVVGKVVNQWISSGKLKREDIFVTTKLPLLGIHPDRVEIFMKKSLENLKLDYVDLYLIHFPVGMKLNVKDLKNFDFKNAVLEPKTDHEALWQKMEEQVKAGRAKHIGLSNYNISQITTVLKTAKIKPANLQVEMHIYLQQRKLHEFCKKNDISVVAYCPIGNPNQKKIMEKLGGVSRELPVLLNDPKVAEIAKKHSKSSAQIALRFLLQIGVAAIPKSVTPKRIEENIDVFDFTLDDGDMKTLYDLDMEEKGRLVDFVGLPGMKNHPDYPFK